MRKNLDLLQGSWTVTALEVEGQKMPATMLANARIVKTTVPPGAIIQLN